MDKLGLRTVLSPKDSGVFQTRTEKCQPEEHVRGKTPFDKKLKGGIYSKETKSLNVFTLVCDTSDTQTNESKSHENSK